MRANTMDFTGLRIVCPRRSSRTQASLPLIHLLPLPSCRRKAVEDCPWIPLHPCSASLLLLRRLQNLLHPALHRPELAPTQKNGMGSGGVCRKSSTRSSICRACSPGVRSLTSLGSPPPLRPKVLEPTVIDASSRQTPIQHPKEFSSSASTTIPRSGVTRDRSHGRPLSTVSITSISSTNSEDSLPGLAFHSADNSASPVGSSKSSGSQHKRHRRPSRLRRDLLSTSTSGAALPPQVDLSSVQSLGSSGSSRYALPHSPISPIREAHDTPIPPDRDFVTPA